MVCIWKHKPQRFKMQTKWRTKLNVKRRRSENRSRKKRLVKLSTYACCCYHACICEWIYEHTAIEIYVDVEEWATRQFVCYTRVLYQNGPALTQSHQPYFKCENTNTHWRNRTATMTNHNPRWSKKKRFANQTMRNKWRLINIQEENQNMFRRYWLHCYRIPHEIRPYWPAHHTYQTKKKKTYLQNLSLW